MRRHLGRPIARSAPNLTLGGSLAPPVPNRLRVVGPAATRHSERCLEAPSPTGSAGGSAPAAPGKSQSAFVKSSPLRISSIVFGDEHPVGVPAHTGGDCGRPLENSIRTGMRSPSALRSFTSSESRSPASSTPIWVSCTCARSPFGRVPAASPLRRRLRTSLLTHPKPAIGIPGVDARGRLSRARRDGSISVEVSDGPDSMTHCGSSNRRRHEKALALWSASIHNYRPLSTAIRGLDARLRVSPIHLQIGYF